MYRNLFNVGWCCVESLNSGFSGVTHESASAMTFSLPLRYLM